jgi:hypothetical protein
MTKVTEMANWTKMAIWTTGTTWLSQEAKGHWKAK